MSQTIITARIYDQTVQITNLPLIASGSQGVLQIRCEFDSSWTGYGKTAVFYRNEGEVYHVPLVDNTATVPSEVLADSGHFFFGIMGVESNTRTTEVVRMEVAQGAITTATATPGEPTPDIYQQLLAAYGVMGSRVDELVAMRSTGGASSYSLSDEYIGGTIKTNGASALIDFTISELSLVGGGYHRSDYCIPPELAPLGQVYVDTSNPDINVTIEPNSTTGWARILIENVSSDMYTTDMVTTATAYYPLASVTISELADARIDYTGATHATAGAAIRAQTKANNDRARACVRSVDYATDALKINNVPITFRNFAADHTGYYLVNTGIKMPTAGITHGSVNIALSTLALAGYTGTETSVSTISLGIYTNAGKPQANRAIVCGEYSGGVGVGVKDSVIYLFLGGDAYRWIISELTVQGVSLITTGGLFEYSGTMSCSRVADLTTLTTRVVLDTLSLADLRRVLQEIYSGANPLLDRVTALEQAETETLTPAKVIAEHRARRLSARQKLRKYAEYIQKYQSMAKLIRHGTAEQKAVGNALKAEFEPFKLLFVGDSHTQLQYAYNDPRTDLNVGMQGRPCGFSNPEHWAYKLWQIFNPLALSYDGTEADHSSYGNILPGNGRSTFIKVENGAEGVTINGAFEYNRCADNNWVLGSCGGQPSKGERQFAFFRDAGSYVEFSIPANTLGFALTLEMFTGTRSNGTVEDEAASSVTVSINGTTAETIDMRVDKQNYKWVGKCPSDTSATTVRITDNSGGWMAVWGIEYYQELPVIPINAAISGGDISHLMTSYQKAVEAQNPDMVVFEPTICNDLPAMHVYSAYQNYFEALNTLTDGNVLVVLPPIPNTTVDNASAYANYQEKRVMIYNMANAYGFPIVDLGSYLQSVYGRRLGAVMPDDIHLGAEGNTALHTLLLNSLFFGES